MCGGTPKVQQRDLKAEQLDAERLATEKANAEISYRKNARRKSSLLANAGGAAGTSYGSALAQAPGKQTLG
jgi:hypothetical protein